MSLKHRAEIFLLRENRWFSKREICLGLGVEERALRAANGEPGLCSIIAISDHKLGFKHVRYASDAEFNEADRRERKHSISNLQTLRKRRQYRRNLVNGTVAPPTELHTNQELLGFKL